jgi:WD40 repeat protein
MAPPVAPAFVERPEISSLLAGELMTQPPAGPVLVTGAAGFGKTTLAARACHQVREYFPDGVLWAELGPEPGADKLVDVLRSLTARVTGQMPPAYATVRAAADEFAAALGERRFLVVIDDAWRPEDVEWFLAGGSRSMRLVTTRRPSMVPGYAIEVPSMTRGEAAALLGRGLPAGSADELEPLLGRADGMPLLLSLLNGAVRSLRDRRSLPLASAIGELVAGLDRRGIGAADQFADTGAVRVESTFKLSLDELAAGPGGPEILGRYESLSAFPEGVAVPCRLLSRLWGLDEVQMAAEFKYYVDRSLVISADADGARLHSVFRELLRYRFEDRAAEASRRLLREFRPPGGWQLLPAAHELSPQLAYHFVQGERREELGELLRDFRFLVARLGACGPLAVESDALACAGDSYALSLLAVLRQDALLLTGHDTLGDLALTLHGRLLSRPEVFAQVTHAEEGLPSRGLVAAHPLPDRADPRLIRVLTGHSEADVLLAWPSGQGQLASLSCDKGTIRLWDPATGRQQAVVTFSGDPARSVLMSPDGRYLAVLHETRVVLSRDHPVAQATVADFARHGLTPGEIETVERTASVVEAASGTLIARCQAPPHRISGPPGVTWSADSTTLAFAAAGTVRLWSPFEEGEPRTLTLDQGRFADAMAWHPRAGLACVTDRGALIWWRDPWGSDRQEVWDNNFGKDEFFGGNHALAWRPDGLLLAMASSRGLLVLDPPHRRVVRQISSLGGEPSVLSWRPDGQALACSWNWPEARTGALIVSGVEQAAATDRPFVINARRSQINGAAWHPSGKYLAVAIEEAIELWCPAAEPADGLRSHGAESVTWQPGGRLLAVTGVGGCALRVVDAEAPDSSAWPDEPVNPGPVAWSPDGRFLVDNHGPIAIRDAATGEIIRELPAEDGFGRRTIVSWPAQERLMALVSFYETVSLIDVGSGRSDVSVSIDRDGRGHGPVTASPDGSMIAVSLAPEGLDVVEMGTGARVILDDSERYWYTCFVPGGRYLAASARTGEVVLWDITVPKVIARQRCEDAYWVAADPTGRFVAVVTWYGKIALFGARTLERICEIAVRGTTTHCDFDSAGEHLAVAGSAGLFLFRIRE